MTTLTANLQSLAHLEEEGVDEIREHIMEGVHVFAPTSTTTQPPLAKRGSLVHSMIITSAIGVGAYYAFRLLKPSTFFGFAAIAAGYFLFKTKKA